MTNPATFAPVPTVPEALPTIWRASDDLWRRIEPVLFELDPPAATGRPRADARAVFDAIIHRGRTSTQVGGRANLSMAEQVARPVGALREEGVQLSWHHATGMCATVVSPLLAAYLSEIVS